MYVQEIFVGEQKSISTLTLAIIKLEDDSSTESLKEPEITYEGF